jgi:hypothetical protein
MNTKNFTSPIKRRLGVASCSLLSALSFSLSTTVSAQNAKPPVTDPNSPVPKITYRSVFQETALGIEREKIDWRKANGDVGRFKRGHIDIIKAEEAEEKKPPTPAPKSNSTHKH